MGRNYQDRKVTARFKTRKKMVSMLNAGYPYAKGTRNWHAHKGEIADSSQPSRYPPGRR